MTVRAQPFLRWAGSKRKQLPLLSSFWKPSYNRYVEPFMGSACLFFAIRPPKALLADSNSELVETFRIVRQHPHELHDRLLRLPRGKAAYYRLRAQIPEALEPADAAARFIYLNRFSFNGLFRTNLQGRFNVPYSANKTGDLPSEDELANSSKALHRATIRASDFEETLGQVVANDFVYLDPPFAVANRRVFKQYGPDTFGIEDLKRLVSGIRQIDARGAAFVVSYAYCKEAIEAFKQWPKRKIMVQRNIAGFARCRRRAAELIVSNAF